MTHDAAATKVQLFKRSPIRPRDQVIEYRAILLRLLTAASVKLFGCRLTDDAAYSGACGPASEKHQRTKPREVAGGGAACAMAI